MATPALSQTTSGEPTPQEAVTELIQAMEAKDAERIRAVFAEEASQRYGDGQPKTGDRFRAWLQSDIIAAEGRVADPVVSADGSAVTVTGEYRNKNNYRSAANFLFEVAGGKITSWTMRY